MLHHVSVGVADVERAAKLYDAALAALGFKRVAQYLPYAIGYGAAGPSFWIQLPHNQQQASSGNGVHVGFSAKTKNAIHKFHEAALANGGKDDGAPGPREMYGPDYYGAFVYDLDGNKLEATLYIEAAPKAAAKTKAKTKASTRKASKKKTSKPKTKKKSKRR